MILEAFSAHLKAANQPLTPEKLAIAMQQSGRKLTEASESREILYRWLMSHLHAPEADNHVTAVIQAELMLVLWQTEHYIMPASPSGQRLLKTLEDYCDSYDQWQFARWLHVIQASDFNNTP